MTLSSPKNSSACIADFSTTIGPVKKVNGMCNTMLLSGMADEILCKDLKQKIKALDIPSTRFHDAEWENPGYGLVDVSRIFPIFSADADNPDNYLFESTDDYLQNAIELGGEIEFRLGESIEHSKPYRVKAPQDAAKWADICMHIVRHYKAGWADGFFWNVNRWCIWEEPDNPRLLYPPLNASWKDIYFQMYECVARLLKKEFPECKIGGPSSTVGQKHVEWFLQTCRQHHVPVDFVTVTHYNHTPEQFIDVIRQERKEMDDNGFHDLEFQVGEWHKHPAFWFGFNGSAGSAYQKYRDSLIHEDCACYAAGVMTLAQDERIDRMNYYSMFYPEYALFEQYSCLAFPVYYVFKAFAELARFPRINVPSHPANGKYLLGSVAPDGKGMLMVTSCNSDAISVQLSGCHSIMSIEKLSDNLETGFQPTSDVCIKNGLATFSGHGCWLITLQACVSC